MLRFTTFVQMMHIVAFKVRCFWTATDTHDNGGEKEDKPCNTFPAIYKIYQDLLYLFCLFKKPSEPDFFVSSTGVEDG